MQTHTHTHKHTHKVNTKFSFTAALTRSFTVKWAMSTYEISTGKRAQQDTKEPQYKNDHRNTSTR